VNLRSGDRREAAYLDELERLLAEAAAVIADGLTATAVGAMREVLIDVRDLDVPSTLGETQDALLHQAALLRHGAARRYDEARTVLADARR
jgi:hypothetical protein